MRINGNTYYVYDDVYYVKKDGNYVVTEPPTNAAAEVADDSAPDPREILKALDAYLETCRMFQVETMEIMAVRQKDGRRKITEVTRSVLIPQPDHLAATAHREEGVNQFWYGSQTATLFKKSKKAYSQVEAPGGNESLLELLRGKFGLTVPLVDLLMPGLWKALEPRIESIRYAGTEEEGGAPRHTISVMTDEFQAQLWVEQNEKAPRPRKVQVVYYSQPGQPRYEAVISSWNDAPEIKDGAFTFTAPEDAVKVEMVPVDRES
jgi:hypothetical protein